MSISVPARAVERIAAWQRLACAIPIPFLAAAAYAGDADPSSPMETVVVSASPITPEDRLATIVETVDRDEILRAGGTSIADALAHTPGVAGTGFAAGASRPVIRGFDANRVRMLEDGIGSFDVADVGPDHGVPIDPLSAERIEVVRGAATLRYGSQAIGGVINAINNRVPTRRPDEPFRAEIPGLYGANAATRQGSATLDGNLGDFVLHVDGFRRATDDYEIPGGTMPNTFSRSGGHAAGGSYFFGRNRVGAAHVAYDSEYGIPGEEAFIDMRQTKQLLRASFAPGLGALHMLNVEGGRADYEHSEIEPVTGEAAATFRDDEWDLRAEALLSALGPVSAAAVGVQFQSREFAALRDAADYLLPTRTESAAVFGFADAPLAPRLHLHVGARVETVALAGTPASGIPASLHFTPVSAAAGLLFDASDALRLGLTLSSAARAPAQTELFARGPHEGSATFEIGEPRLDVERANSLEATLRFDARRASFEGALWDARFRDYIFGALTGRSCDEEGNCVAGDAEELRELIIRQTGARFWGAEAKATFDVWGRGSSVVQAVALADYVRARLSGGENVPRISPYHVGFGLSWAGRSVGAGMFMRYTGRQDELGSGETATPGFVSLDAQASWRPLAKIDALELVLVGKNLTDSTQRNAVALNKDEVVLPGREVRLMFRARL
jgi:iron complex outermembrane recepter protein